MLYYIAEDAVVSNYVVTSRNCSACATYGQRCSSNCANGDCTQTCTNYCMEYVAHACFDTAVTFNYTVVDDRARFCVIDTASGVSNLTEAVAAVRGEFAVGSSVTLYVDKSFDECHLGTSVEWLAYGGMVMMVVAGLLLVVACGLLAVHVHQRYHPHFKRPVSQLSRQADTAVDGRSIELPVAAPHGSTSGGEAAVV